jgi:hypothetical protein
MKRINIKTFIKATIMMLFLPACNNILDETPRSIFTPEYFKSTNGVMGGLTAMYGHTRYIWGNAYYYDACLTGTDEATYGASGSTGSFGSFDFSGSGSPVSASNDDAAVLWNTAIPNINLASGIIENGTLSGISPALLAEARFFRAFDYFMLVQTFGGIPLDLGAGELKFNTTPTRTSVRSTVPEVYTKAIFPDLDTAINRLPATPRVTGAVTKTVARLYLAKAYLTYAWWLENPNNIPTYPVCDRTDPDGHNAAWYYQQAYAVATTAIANPGPYGLQPTFYNVNAGSNDRNMECLLYADHTQSSQLNNGADLSYGSGGGQDNFAGWMMTFNYTALNSSKVTPWDNDKNHQAGSVQRLAAQGYGRPWVRMAPPIEVFTNTFADKANDSRYDGTFQTVLRANFNLTGTGITQPTMYNANNLAISPGDAVLSFIDTDPGGIDYTNSVYNSKIGAGVLPGRADYVIPVTLSSRINYPTLWKLGPYRTDNAGSLGQPNASSTRPFVIAKFSELYFIAAEAAVKGATTLPGQSARELINVIRARAGKWSWSNADNTAKVVDNSIAMTTATPDPITINYILAERSREYYGEGYRWYDLVRTQKWNELCTTYTICGTSLDDKTPKPYTRTIKPNLYLRPIPQSQFDGMEMTAEELAAYQNPGY